jgi:phosphodiesterase/alkaline phosphatase D-like protein
VNAGAGTGSSAVSAVVSGLTPATLYHYRLAAANSGGTTNGSDGTFTTGTAAGIPPVVSASAATAITPSGAQLNGTVNPSGLATTYHFDYGTTTSYGTSTTLANAGAGTVSSSVSAVLSGLTPGTLYHYRVSASNNGGTANSSDRTMTTAVGPPAPAMPVVATLPPSNVGATVANLAGTVNPNGVSTAYHFEYGSTISYGSLTSTSDAGTGSAAVDVSAVLTNLSPGTLYHYRLVGTNAGGTVNGGDMTFTGLSMSVHPGLKSDPHSLSQNYPNPFNPSTQIQYDLNVASLVSMKVYNSLGAEVATLVSEFQDAGTHLVQWGGQGFVSGIYFCVLKSGGMTSTRRMILLK